VHPPHLRQRAKLMMALDVPFSDICRTLGLPKGTVGKWFYGERARRRRLKPPPETRCFRCASPPGEPADPAAYTYLLGLYLGDGHLVTSAKVPVLRIYCADAWPRLIDLCEEAMLAVLARKVQRVQKRGCVSVESTSKHWPCLIPQHGPGRKHDRPIVLRDWQRTLVQDHPGPFVRGLFHSDGCRIDNRVTVRGRAYTYPRYLFVNESADIMALCRWGLDLLGVAWRMNRRNSLSVARRAAVAALDRHVGPKS